MLFIWQKIIQNKWWTAPALDWTLDMNNHDKLYGESVYSNAIALKLDLKLEARLKEADAIYGLYIVMQETI